MAIKNNMTRVQVIMDKGTKKKVEDIAKKENRSISNWIYNLIRSKLK